MRVVDSLKVSAFREKQKPICFCHQLLPHCFSPSVAPLHHLSPSWSQKEISFFFCNFLFSGIYYIVGHWENEQQQLNHLKAPEYMGKDVDAE